MKRPKIINDGIGHHKVYKDSGTFIWTMAPASERKKVDAYLVAIKHPSAMEPGTAENRFKSIVRELAKKKNPVKRKTKKQTKKKTTRRRNPVKYYVIFRWDGKNVMYLAVNSAWVGPRNKGKLLSESLPYMKRIAESFNYKGSVIGVADKTATANAIKQKVLGKK